MRIICKGKKRLTSKRHRFLCSRALIPPFITKLWYPNKTAFVTARQKFLYRYAGKKTSCTKSRDKTCQYPNLSPQNPIIYIIRPKFIQTIFLIKFEHKHKILKTNLNQTFDCAKLRENIFVQRERWERNDVAKLSIGSMIWKAVDYGGRDAFVLVRSGRPRWS